MDSLTIQAVNNSLITAVGEKLLQAELQNIPAQMVIKPGENILLQVLTEDNPSSPLLKAKLVVENKEIPVQIKTELPLKTEHKPVADIVAKAVGRTEQGALPVQIVSVNGQRGEVYLSTLRQEKIPVQTEAPLWVNKTGEVPQIELLPLRLAPVVENELQKTSLPQEIKQTIIAEAKRLEMPLTVKAIAEPPEQTADILKPLRQVFDKFVQLPETERSLPMLQKEVQTALQSFSAKEIPATVQIKGNGNIMVLSTVLGDVLPETPLKMPVGTPVLLQTSDIIIAKQVVSAENPVVLPDKTAALPPVADENIKLSAEQQPVMNKTPFLKAPVEELLSKLADILPPERFSVAAEKGLPDILWPAEKNAFVFTAKEMPPLLKVLEPILSDKQAVQTILDKLPAANGKLLSNIVGFVKASDTGDIKDWLGKETVDNMAAKGEKGAEAVSRLTQYVASNTREGVVWRTVEIPFLGNGISTVKLAVKKKQQDDENENQAPQQKKEARFILETDFSKLGKFQFDGFSIAQDRRFDLIVRTSKLLPDDFCVQMVALYKTSLHAVDYHGSIKLNLKENFIKIADDEPGDISIKDGLYI